MSPETDQILSGLVEAQETVQDCEEDLARLRAERDQAIVKARKTGTTVAELMRLTGLTRATIYKALERA